MEEKRQHVKPPVSCDRYAAISKAYLPPKKCACVCVCVRAREKVRVYEWGSEMESVCVCDLVDSCEGKKYSTTQQVRLFNIWSSRYFRPNGLTKKQI
jgi:hypothetical protein